MGTVCQCCAVLGSSYCCLPSWVLGGASAPGRVTEIWRLWVPTGDAVGCGCCPQPSRIPDHPRVLSGEDGSKGWDGLSCSLSPRAAPSSWGGDCPEDPAPGTSRRSCPRLLAPARVPRSCRRMRPDESRSFQGALTQLCCVSAAGSGALSARMCALQCRGLSARRAVVQGPADAAEREMELGTTVTFLVTRALAPGLSLERGPPGGLRIPSQAPALRSPGITTASGHRAGLWKCALWTVSKWAETASAAAEVGWAEPQWASSVCACTRGVCVPV